MFGGSFSAKVIAAVATISLPLLATTGAIGFAPANKEAKELSNNIRRRTRYLYDVLSEAIAGTTQAVIVTRSWSPFSEHTGAIGFATAKPLCGGAASDAWSNSSMPCIKDILDQRASDATKAIEKKSSSLLKMGSISTYYLPAKKTSELGSLSEVNNTIRDKTPDVPEDYMQPRTSKTVLSAIYAPSLTFTDGHYSDAPTYPLCSAFLTDSHFFLGVPFLLNNEFLSLASNKSLPTEIYHRDEVLHVIIYVLSGQMGTPPNEYSQRKQDDPLFFLQFIDDKDCREFVKEQFQGIKKFAKGLGTTTVMHNGHKSPRRAREGILIFVHWLIYFATNFPRVFEDPDDGYFRPAFEAMLEGISEKYLIPRYPAGAEKKSCLMTK